MELNPLNLSTNHNYPPPPNVHWLVLVAVYVLVEILTVWLLPRPYQAFVDSLLFYAWGFYLCLWIRKLDPVAQSLSWLNRYALVDFALLFMMVRENPSGLEQFVIAILAIGSFVLGLNTIYQIRADLLNHYNRREPIGLHLGGVLTFFFSYFYFQSQLNEISAFKRDQAEACAINAGRNLMD
jgi:hypothetical protein